MSVPKVVSQVKSLIENDDSRSAIKLLSEAFKNDKAFNGIILLTARNNRLREQLRSGTVDFERSSVERNKINEALLDLCIELEERYAYVQPYNSRDLLQFPRGPLVEGYLIDESIIEEVAKAVPPRRSMQYIEKANRLRKKAEPENDRVTIIQPYTLLSPNDSRPLDFWMDAFNEARMHGPRMLAALLFALEDLSFSSAVQQEIKGLLENIKTV